MNEAGLQAKIIKSFFKAGVYCRKMRSESATGFPDLFAGRAGNVVLIEVKNPKGTGKLEDSQVEEIALLRSYGLPVYVVASLDEALELLTLWE